MPRSTSNALRRATIARIAAITGVAVIAAGTVTGLLSFASTARADGAPSTIVKVTGVLPHLVPALTDKQILTITGTGFAESAISGVAIQGCVNDPVYIVTSATSMLVKTDDSCAATANAVVTITDASGDLAVSNPTSAVGSTALAQALSIVAMPTIWDASDSGDLRHPVVTENTAGLSYPAQVTAAPTQGGTVVRITSGSTPFATSTALPLSATLDGVAITGLQITGSGPGNHFTGTLGAHAADSAPVLKITNNGLTKSFAYGLPGPSADGTFDFVYGGPLITVSPAYGPSNGGNTLTITGGGFSTTTSEDAVTVGGVNCPVTGTPTAIAITCMVPMDGSPFEGPVTVHLVVAGTGAFTSIDGAGSTYTYLAQ